MEFIRVQAAGFPEDVITSGMLAFVEDLENSPDLRVTDVYTHTSVNEYYAISLLWDTDQPQSTGSRIGLNIREALKKYGLVDHSVWIKKN